uniref:Uncharacterized protein n=1 Tax=Sphaerodactylus townsendi TaxID=933632 RepID=A0ACB8EY06_9SAUR
MGVVYFAPLLLAMLSAVPEPNVSGINTGACLGQQVRPKNWSPSPAIVLMTCSQPSPWGAISTPLTPMSPTHVWTAQPKNRARVLEAICKLGCGHLFLFQSPDAFKGQRDG